MLRQIYLQERNRVGLEKLKWLLLLAGIVFPVYFIIGAIWQNPADPRVLANTARVVTTIDRWIPFSPIWMFVYMAVYTFMLLPIMTVRDGLLFRRTGMAYLFVLVASYSVFIVYPITTRDFRPDYPQLDDTIFWQWVAALEFFCDPPMNCLPSLHLGIAFMAGFGAWQVDRGGGAIAVTFAALIGLSTALVKQHYLIDVATGILTAYIAYLIFVHPLPRPAHDSGQVRGARLGLLMYLGVYLATIGLLGTLFLAGFRPWHQS